MMVAANALPYRVRGVHEGQISLHGPVRAANIVSGAGAKRRA